MAVASKGRVVSEDATLDAFVEPESADDQASSDADDSSSVEADAGGAEAVTDADAAESVPGGVRSDPADDGEADAPADDGESAEAVETLSVTSTWSDAAACADCGETVPRLWQDGGVRVCAGCKSWRTTGEEPCDR